MVVVMFRWQKLTDARGKARKPCQIRNACKISGYEKRFLIRRGDTTRFVVGFCVTGIPYAVLMAILMPMLMRFAIGSSGSSSLLTYQTLRVFVFHLVMFGGIMGGFLTLYGWRNASSAIRAMTRAGLCPSCAYKIDELVPEPDGCTVCPECGAAWRMHA
jgi:hypothetical protein